MKLRPVCEVCGTAMFYHSEAKLAKLYFCPYCKKAILEHKKAVEAKR